MGRGSVGDADEALVAALRAGDEEAFERLVREWSGAMLHTARLYVDGQAAAEDVVQETWIAVVQGIDRFRGESKLRTWVFRILANRAKTRGERDHRAVPLSALDGPGGPAVDPDRFRGEDDRWPAHWRSGPEPWPELIVLSAEARERALAAIEALPARQRAVISLRDVEGWDAKEVCTALDLSEANQRVLLHRARTAVRRELEEYVTGEVSP